MPGPRAGWIDSAKRSGRNRRNLDVKPAVGEADEQKVGVPDGICRQLQDILDEVPEAAELRVALHAAYPNAERRCLWLMAYNADLGGQSPAELLQNATQENIDRVSAVVGSRTVNLDSQPN